MKSFRPSGSVTKLDSASLDTFLSEQEPFEQDEPVLDLRTIELITPAALVQLAAVIHTLADRGHPPVLLLEDAPIRSYLHRVRFTQAIAGAAEVQPAESPLEAVLYGGQRGSNPMVIEVTKIESGSALPPLLNQIVWVLRHRLRYRKHDSFDVATAVSEVCQNTFDHNAATRGFVAMQVYGKGKGRFLEFGVSDHGVGLRATLCRNPKNGVIHTDLQAIQLAAEAGTSEHDDPTRGTGLYHLLEIAFRYAGSVQIWSGAAKVRFRMDKHKIWTFDVPMVPGVHIAMTLPSRTT